MKIRKTRDFKIIEDFLKQNFSSPTHWPDWNLVIEKSFKTHFFYYTLISKGGEIVGIMPVHQEKDGFLIKTFSGQFKYMPYGGWLFSNEHKKQDYPIPLCVLGNTLVYGLPHLPDFYVSFAEFKNRKETLIIDLNATEESIWTNSIHSKRRNMIRKAEKERVKIHFQHKFDHDFYHSYEDASQRNGLYCLARTFFDDLNNSSGNINFLVLTATSMDDQTLGNVVIAHDKDYALYWLGNNSSGVPNLGHGEFLQWEAIKYLKNKGCKYYDLCYIEKERLTPIYKYKKGFSKQEISIPFHSEKGILFRLINKAKKWV